MSGGRNVVVKCVSGEVKVGCMPLNHLSYERKQMSILFIGVLRANKCFVQDSGHSVPLWCDETGILIY